MLPVLLISPQCVKNFSDNFSEQLVNKTDFNSKIDFSCCCLKCEVKIVFLFSKKVQKKVLSHGGDRLFTRCFATLRTLKHHLSHRQPKLSTINDSRGGDKSGENAFKPARTHQETIK